MGTCVTMLALNCWRRSRLDAVTRVARRDELYGQTASSLPEAVNFSMRLFPPSAT